MRGLCAIRGLEGQGRFADPLGGEERSRSGGSHQDSTCVDWAGWGGRGGYLLARNSPKITIYFAPRRPHSFLSSPFLM